ncbi:MULTISPECIES: alpha/beta fold hydrolase [unclassified Brenneria]|uniref:RBBP9/YdeN family alpha/beta hydrolase n=1 Tax=unclassified Brenneria TaxID=2634434 RepID=UPI0029C37A86|nr:MULTISPECIES: alpha/beta fold hydrolase [unclassified Brenneria]MDX5629096.1 alpha/beta hydrolase [Brenneria sp. L3-3Z]MDX5696235.1 alpha/beta hydrolase [Brenneria sp. L4-2C]
MSYVNNIIIVHGFLSTPRHHWFQWLRQQCEDADIRVLIPQMPKPRAPRPEKWLAKLRNTIDMPNEKTWFIGHSLGCITVLRYLSSLHERLKVGGVILVSGFAEQIETHPELSDFTATPIDFDLLRKAIKHRITILSSNDTIVAPRYTVKLREQLDAELYSFNGCGHFLDCDGFHQFPALRNILRDHLK